MGSKACRLFVLTVKELLSQNGGLLFSPQLAVCACALTCNCICVCSWKKLAPVQHLRVSNSVWTSN